MNTPILDGIKLAALRGTLLQRIMARSKLGLNKILHPKTQYGIPWALREQTKNVTPANWNWALKGQKPNDYSFLLKR